MKKIILFNLIFLFFITSCQKESLLGSTFPDGTVVTPLPIGPKPGGGTPTPLTDYQLGYNTGIADADLIFTSSYWLGQCFNLKFVTNSKNFTVLDKNRPQSPDNCWSPQTPQSEFYYTNFLVDYRSLVGDLINQFPYPKKSFYLGMLAGFNYQTCLNSLNSGLSGHCVI